ncbi:MFS transporter [Pseudooceanicola sp. CBS1P-1]|uniref:MFS transporter n=1 Tax=Pseudooceanicola albus TaxID=2692189 RepID=A0A6L7G1R6_9RHOB|nr:MULTISPECIES: MFS transporter [Pseudooceanicola]MBT9383555.1 MFS transporter [Pseudooceanicola endophyticus]MXN17410.1 MFS transporter [Pseudooceanicola albus]
MTERTHSPQALAQVAARKPAQIPAQDPVQVQLRSPGLAVSLLLALACGVLAADIYYAQPLVGLIAASLGLPAPLAGLVVTLTQLGYGLGLILVVPLADIFETRRLVLTLVGLSILALVATALAPTAGAFLAAAFCTGLGAVAVQVLVPYAAHLADEASRGRAVGNVMAGLMLGIMLARPLSSFLAGLAGWQGVFLLAAAALVPLGLVLRLKLPERRPAGRMGYGALMRSILSIAATTPVLQRRALYQAAMFGVFSLFWTVTPLLLASPAIGLGQGGIAIFALVGAASVLASPIAGRIADRGWGRPATRLALLGGMASFALCLVLPEAPRPAIALLIVAALLLDFAVTTNLVLGQREIFLLEAAIRARLNGIYMATFFLGGALGSALGVWAYAAGGWHMAALLGLAAPTLAFLFALSERR